jgi:4-alpha-glucanotransferase
VLYFERLGDGRFRSPGDYPGESVATVGTHDLPTLAGYWEGRDVAVREQLGIFSSADAGEARQRRRDDRRHLCEALADAGFSLPDLAKTRHDAPPELIDAVHRFLAGSSARLFLAQLDDLLGEADQLNVPGTVEAYPNWRRKLSVALEAPALVQAIVRLARLCQEQGRGRPREPRA